MYSYGVYKWKPERVFFRNFRFPSATMATRQLLPAQYIRDRDRNWVLAGCGMCCLTPQTDDDGVYEAHVFDDPRHYFLLLRQKQVTLISYFYLIA